MQQLQKLMTEYGIEYFSAAELFIPMKSFPPEELYPNIIPTLIVADSLRECCGFPISVSSSYRNKAHNQEVGGSPNSLHLVFNALDLRPMMPQEHAIELMHYYFEDYTCEDHPRFYEFDATKFTQKDMGIGLYNWGLHIDTRGLMGRSVPARWDERT